MSIFSEENKVTGSVMKFKNVKDKIEGTLLSIRDTVSTLSGNPQQVYEIKASGKEVITEGKSVPVKEGDVWVIYSTKFIENQMRHINVGQIIGLIFEKEEKPKQNGHNPMKCITVFANSNIVDEKFLASRDASETANEQVSEAPSNDENFAAELDTSASSMVKDEVYALAKEKLGATDDEDDIKLKVMEATKKAFIDQNLEEILAELKKL